MQVRCEISTCSISTNLDSKNYLNELIITDYPRIHLSIGNNEHGTSKSLRYHVIFKSDNLVWNFILKISTSILKDLKESHKIIDKQIKNLKLNDFLKGYLILDLQKYEIKEFTPEQIGEQLTLF